MAHHRRRMTWMLPAAVAALAAAAAGTWLLFPPSSPPRAAAHRLHHGTRAVASAGTVHPPPEAATFAGPDGVEARWVVAENRRPGTTSWRITAHPPGTIAGWFNRVSSPDGGTATLYVTTDAATLRVAAYRMGYYGGDGARLVWESPPVTGRRQPACPVTPVTNMVSCANWSPTLRIPITSRFVQGDYLFKLVGSGGQQSYVPLTVTDPSSRATYLVKNDVFTWQAWNAYGGYDLYQGLGACPPGASTYPPCNRARVVSFDRPYAYGHGAGDFLGNELPFVYWAEEHGLDVTYTTDVNVNESPAILLRHTTLLSLGHDECWALDERLGAQRAASLGHNIVFFGASPVLRHVRLQASPIGPQRQEVDYRDSTEDPLDRTGPADKVTGNWWGTPPTNMPEAGFVGEAYSGFLLPGARPAPMVVSDASAWIFAGLHVRDGTRIPGVLVSDFDQVDPALHPADLQVFSHSPIPPASSEAQFSPAYSDMTYWTEASGGGIFDTGTVAWIPDLPHVQALRTMTGNLLRLFGTGPAAKLQPSHANGAQFAG